MKKDSLLRSWKEIAAHLGCQVRTCHRWEQKLGMPVYRAEGIENKSPVFAYKDELDLWFQKTFTNSNVDRGRTITGPISRSGPTTRGISSRPWPSRTSITTATPKSSSPRRG